MVILSKRLFVPIFYYHTEIVIETESDGESLYSA